MDDQFPRDGVEHTQHRRLFGLAGRGNAEVRAPRRPGMGEIGMGQSFGFIFIQQNDITGPGLLTPDLKTKTDTVDLSRVLAAFQRVPRAPPAEPLFA
jgi:hypothetical protein